MMSGGEYSKGRGVKKTAKMARPGHAWQGPAHGWESLLRRFDGGRIVERGKGRHAGFSGNLAWPLFSSRAAQQFLSALKLDPAHRPSHAALADYYARQSDPDAAALAEFHRRRAQLDSGPTPGRPGR